MLKKRELEDPEEIAGKSSIPIKKLKTGEEKAKEEEGSTDFTIYKSREEYDPQKYKISKSVGQGTFGVVFKAKNNYTKKTVAIKKTLQDPQRRNREFEILVELDHPNCIKVHNFYLTEEKDQNEQDRPKYLTFLHIVMDYYSQSLYDMIRFYQKSLTPFPDALCTIYSYQLLRAINYVKKLKLSHRDVKPQNIMINTKNQQLVLCDFGSAKRMNPGESSLSYICSRYYRAPELLLGQEFYDYKIDVWSVGCVIAELYQGVPIFPGKSSQDQFFRIASIIGKPTQREVEAMNHEYKGPLPEVEHVTLQNLLTNKNPLAVDLLTKLLVYDPKKRIDPLKALMHPYFDQLRMKEMTVNGRAIVDLFDFSMDEVEGDIGIFNHLVPRWYREKMRGV